MTPEAAYLQDAATEIAKDARDALPVDVEGLVVVVLTDAHPRFPVFGDPVGAEVEIEFRRRRTALALELHLRLQLQDPGVPGIAGRARRDSEFG